MVYIITHDAVVASVGSLCSPLDERLYFLDLPNDEPRC